MQTLKNGIFVLAIFGAVFAYTGMANSLEITSQPGISLADETAAEEKANEETKSEEKAREAENTKLGF